MPDTGKKWLHFYGVADDIFIAEGITRVISHLDNYNIPVTEVLEVTSEEGALFVLGRYVPDMGCWLMGVVPVTEDAVIPEWPVTMSLMDGFGTRLSIEAPCDARVSVYPDRKEKETTSMASWG